MKLAIAIKKQLVYGVLVYSAALTLSNVSLAQRPLSVELPEQCSQIRVDEDNSLAYHVYALGVQNYTWDGTSWALTGPMATLYAAPNFHGKVGTHHGGPTWVSNSGGLVIGKKEYDCAPDPNSIPWLRLRAEEVDGVGMFSDTTFIQRVNTSGGKAPVNPGAYDGQPVSVPYSAEYIFYRAERP
ncbi:MAG: hypothetical protein DMF63_14350 [Acidobacteria bacterium]|nr:MAG: hypothetical protein DMF63_14350 [Acidobacteriota bacterium]